MQNGTSAEPTREIIEKWYRRLNFPQEYDAQFRQALDTIPIQPGFTIEDYDLDCPDGKRNLLSFLYLCEGLEEQYREKGISGEILLDTLRDIVIWTRNWTQIRGELCLFELAWLARILRMKLFTLGRLQFYMAPCRADLPTYGIAQGDPVMEIHIPRGGKLDPEAVEDSFVRSVAFFARYYPDFSYPVYTCASWLLDDGLQAYLPERSNILAFARRFDVVGAREDDAILRFLFPWDTDREKLPGLSCSTAFTRAIKDAALDGAKFYVAMGVINARN